MKLLSAELNKNVQGISLQQYHKISEIHMDDRQHDEHASLDAVNPGGFI